jgi:hypothetical protein
VRNVAGKRGSLREKFKTFALGVVGAFGKILLVHIFSGFLGPIKHIIMVLHLLIAHHTSHSTHNT